jgi:hypothetical protein
MRKVFSGLLVLALLLIFSQFQVFAQEKKEGKVFKYGGVATCKACHMTKKSGAQYKIWQKGPHAKAYQTLKSPKAKEIGKKLGVEDPANSKKCVKCHVTAYEAPAELKGPKLTLEEGIGCEACHGPGSEYKKKKIITAIWEGKLKAADYGLIKPVTEEVCLTCHNEESPTFKEFIFKERVAKIAHPVPKAGD